MRKLASAIAKLEGKKSEVSIGDVREILKIIVKLQSDCDVYETSPACLIADAGEYLAKKKRK